MEYVIFLAGVIVGAFIALCAIALAIRSDRGVIGRRL
jgi:hypothetical protein